jgi:Flp pilus assembly pilin Flp
MHAPIDKKGKTDPSILHMDAIITSALRIFLRLRESLRGQTMTEYAFVLAAVAIAVYATYEIFGQDVSSMVNRVDVQLAGS